MPQIEHPPEPITSDYVELGTLVVLFVVGGPLNLAAWQQLQEHPIGNRLDILKRHLNYTDLLVMFIYCPSRALWLITYDWRGGNALCKMVAFLHGLTFQISANVIVCIALDRLLAVLKLSRSAPDRGLRQTQVGT